MHLDFGSFISFISWGKLVTWNLFSLNFHLEENEKNPGWVFNFLIELYQMKRNHPRPLPRIILVKTFGLTSKVKLAISIWERKLNGRIRFRFSRIHNKVRTTISNQTRMLHPVHTLTEVKALEKVIWRKAIPLRRRMKWWTPTVHHQHQALDQLQKK